MNACRWILQSHRANISYHQDTIFMSPAKNRSIFSLHVNFRLREINNCNIRRKHLRQFDAGCNPRSFTSLLTWVFCGAGFSGGDGPKSIVTVEREQIKGSESLVWFWRLIGSDCNFPNVQANMVSALDGRWYTFDQVWQFVLGTPLRWQVRAPSPHWRWNGHIDRCTWTDQRRWIHGADPQAQRREDVWEEVGLHQVQLDFHCPGNLRPGRRYLFRGRWNGWWATVTLVTRLAGIRHTYQGWHIWSHKAIIKKKYI